jgi:membrane associated rhomboid family serine protease
MQQNYYYRQVRFGPGHITPVIRNLIIANVAVFLLQSILNLTSMRGFLELHGGMVPALFIYKLHLWQPVTYMFLHGGVTHILFNMLALWMFGCDVEERMGSRTFAVFYFFCGVCAGLMTCAFWKSWNIPTIGASGAIFGVLLAFGLMFPDRMILVFFIVPMKAFYFVIGMGMLELYYLIFSQGGGISYIAHVSGMLFGFVFLRFAGRIMGAVDGATGKLESRTRRIDARSLEEDRRKVDEILDKIGREGIHKLSRAERNFLKDHIRRNKSG